ncbi:hypothetical protein GCM10017783_09290 [Deinococcus piscis]|uniref:Uncharacterized protein n=1 Tax=Deinococcus piscis TaxID=394230 RepID=A0ABQ3K1G4_9DEIO|nr:hypothetical protein [Deinococcus piscis]GHF99403.1 hypothetical protein GCM10017783_09290 [Deinococcus piscis]
MRQQLLCDRLLKLGVPLVLCLIAAQAQAAAFTFITPTYRVTVTPQCAEGSVTCNDVSYLGQNRRTGQSLRLRGRTEHVLCADGVTPCRFVGYVFQNGSYRYAINEDQSTLNIWRGHTLIWSEVGQWQQERN